MEFVIMVAAFIMAVVALNKIARLNFRVTSLTSNVSDLATLVAKLQKKQAQIEEQEIPADAAAPVRSAPVSSAPRKPKPLKAVAAAISAKAGAVSEPAHPVNFGSRGNDEESQASSNLSDASKRSDDSKPAAAGPLPAADKPLVTAKPQAPKRDMEQAIASRWFVWVGGLAIAVGGLLFVKYAYDNGYISPALQISLGLALAAALIFAGERLRRASPLPTESNYVPAALSAAGLVIAFASVFAAYALYELIQPATAFIGLALIGIAALFLSLRQGPLIAALGLLGSYATPTIIPSGHPSAWTFFPYLLIIMAACFAVLRKRPWAWLGYAAIAGSAAWSFLWLAGPYQLEDTIALGLFALAFGTIALFGMSLKDVLSETSGSLQNPVQMSGPLMIGATGVAVASLVLATLVLRSGHSGSALVLFFAGMACVAAFSWFKRGKSLAAAAAALLSLIVLMGWREAAFHEWVMEESGLWTTVLLGEAPQFMNWMLGAGLAFTALGIIGYVRRHTPLTWASIAAGSALLFVTGAWARVDGLMTFQAWAMLAAGAALVLLAAVWLRRSYMTQPSDNLAAGILCAGSALLALFAADRLFDHIWLTLACAALALGYACLARPLAVKMLGPVSAALGTLVTLRLFAARELWLDERALPLGPHWPLYGYGVPVVLLFLASRWLKSTRHAQSAISLEAISLGLAISLVSLELRVLIGGGLTAEHPQLLEMSAHILTWLGAAYGLLYRQRLYSSLVATWGARVLIAASALALIGGPLLVLNPMLSGEVLQGGSFFNALLLAFLAPASLLWLIARRLAPAGLELFRPAIELFAVFLLTVFAAVEIKRLYNGPLLSIWPSDEVEASLHILAWLGLACALVWGASLLSPPASVWGARALIALSAVGIIFGSMAVFNPVLSGIPLRGGAVFNSLLLSYVAPIALLAFIAQRLGALGWTSFRPAFGGAALLLSMAYLTLETKRLFQGPDMVARALSNAESYAYSAVWLAAALALFLAGIRLAQKYVRYAGLGVIVLVVLKVFLLDMSNLEGLYRIASFMGLGLCLVAIGWLYQRFVQKPAAP
jgi:uncharacterized membrane protein